MSGLGGHFRWLAAVNSFTDGRHPHRSGQSYLVSLHVKVSRRCFLPSSDIVFWVSIVLHLGGFMHIVITLKPVFAVQTNART